jgi:hypothetical protein
MNLQEALKVEVDREQSFTNKLVELLENTIIAKALFNKHKGNNPWEYINNQLGEDNYFNPNFTIFSRTLHRKMDELGYETSEWRTAMYNAVDTINNKCGKKVFNVEPIKNTICIRWNK